MVKPFQVLDVDFYENNFEVTYSLGDYLQLIFRVVKKK